MSLFATLSPYDFKEIYTDVFPFSFLESLARTALLR
jgi:hypothetical protein